MALPLLPPAFRLVAVDREVDAFERARKLAPGGLEDGTVYWTDRADRLRLAVALEPEAPEDTTLQMVYVLAAAAGDALGGLLPPGLPLTFGWPGGILLDGARLGQVRAAVAATAGPEAVPAWLVLGLDIAVGRYPGEPGEVPDRTTLADAGAPEITVVALAESVGRHLLGWTYRWQEEGLAPVRAAWNARCHDRWREGGVTLDGRHAAGKVSGLDMLGGFRIGAETLPLGAALAELGRLA
ncbi:MAG TPA: biotin/lipoate--protein ligase family protein [Geminicoccaceae bacterium]|nr:biotin/lipoate--protein ligase family protein [Geminicoccaceae bacterium]